MDMQAAIRTVTERRDLSEAEMTAVVGYIMTGQATAAQIGGFLIGLRMKGETVTEIAAAARVMRDLATSVKVTGAHVVDIVGTGGDSAGTFNISTTSAFVVAAAGGRVAKHGNRSVSSRSGSADVLEAAGVKLEISPAQVARCVDEVGLGFMFAPRHHSAMKHAIGPRKEMGVRTVFNLLGPLTNPAGAPNQLLGVFSRDWVEPMAQVLDRLGSDHVLVVHSEDGLDEISVGAPTHVAELRAGSISTYTITPDQFGIMRAPLEALRVSSVEESVAVLKAVLANQAGPALDVVALNAGAAIYTAGLVSSLADGVSRAQEMIASGAAAEKLQRLVALTNSF